VMGDWRVRDYWLPSVRLSQVNYVTCVEDFRISR